MLPLLAVLVAGAGLLALGSGGKKSSAPAPVKLPGFGVARSKPWEKILSPQLPTLAQLLAAQQQALLDEAVLADAIHVAQARTHRPDLASDPDVIAAWANDYHLSATGLRALTPQFGWHTNPDAHEVIGGHPETAYRAEYKLDANRGAVSWWANKDGTWGYDHVWGGFDLWKSIEELAKDINDAATWLNNALNSVDWKTIADDIQAVASLVPVLGTAVSDVVATAEVIAEQLSGDPPLQKLIEAAYDYALATVPGGASLHKVLDPVKDAIIRVALKGERLSKVIIDDIAAQAPETPDIAGVNPRSIAASLLVIVAHALGVQT